jgi:ribosomal 50S subunit-recycling heat shock protein
VSEGVRLDKWLWAARFFKTRSLATDAVDRGRVTVNGDRAKPARNVKVGDVLDIDNGSDQWEVDVMGLSDVRGPAPVARNLYEETDVSVARRAAGGKPPPVPRARHHHQGPSHQARPPRTGQAVSEVSPALLLCSNRTPPLTVLFDIHPQVDNSTSVRNSFTQSKFNWSRIFFSSMKFYLGMQSY